MKKKKVRKVKKVVANPVWLPVEPSMSPSTYRNKHKGKKRKK